MISKELFIAKIDYFRKDFRILVFIEQNHDEKHY